MEENPPSNKENFLKKDTGLANTSEYLAQRMCQERGFRLGTVPEAKELLEESDIILRSSQGLLFQIICIIDREKNPEKTFSIPLEKLVAIGKECRKYAGKVNFSRLPVHIHIWEVGNTPFSQEDKARADALRKRVGFDKIHVSFWYFDTQEKTLWTNIGFGGRLAGRSFLQKLLQEPRKTPEEIAKARVPIGTNALPFVSVLLVVFLLLCFAAEFLFAVLPKEGLSTPHVLTLVALGGVSQDLVLGNGEWHRLIAAAFLHADIIHLLLNGIFLVLAGLFLESTLGRSWIMVLFFVGAISGSLASLALNPAYTISVGASGGLMGLLSAALIASFRYPPGHTRSEIQHTVLRILVPSLIPIAISTQGEHIDYAAHLGGTISGALFGLILWKIWPKDQAVPQFASIAKLLSFAFVLLLIFSFFQVYRFYPTYQKEAKVVEQLAILIPDEELPKSEEEFQNRLAKLRKTYPKDPRVHYVAALENTKKNDLANAEKELQLALQEKNLWDKTLPQLEPEIRIMLSAILLEQSRKEEARNTIKPLCQTQQKTLTPSLRSLCEDQ